MDKSARGAIKLHPLGEGTSAERNEACVAEGVQFYSSLSTSTYPAIVLLVGTYFILLLNDRKFFDTSAEWVHQKLLYI